MKKMMMALIMVLMMAAPSYAWYFSPEADATADATANANAIGVAGPSIYIGGGGATVNAPTLSPSATAVIEDGAIDNTNIGIVAPTIKNKNINDIDIKNKNINNVDIQNKNTNLNVNDVDIKNTNLQGQSQDQKQKQNQNQGQVQGQMNNWTQTYISERELPTAPQVVPPVVPLIQGGRIGDVTGQIARFAIAAKPYNGEPVVKILRIVKGSIFDRVRLEDVEKDLLNAYGKLVPNSGDLDPKKIRYVVQYKDSAMGTGLSMGGAGNVSALNGGSSAYGGSGSVGTGIGYSRSTADPAYIIKFFLVE